MILKKKVLSTALFTTMVGLSFGVSAADQNTANVTLSGLISAVTCDIDVNGITGGTTVNTGVHNSAQFTGKAHNVAGTPTPMVVTLKNCQGDTGAGEGGGNLYISGTTANNGNNNIFVGNDSATGFMVLKTGGTTSTDALQNHGSIPLDVTVPDGGASYTFNVAMASTSVAPTAGLYTAPIIISYASE
ncbi:fimbrial protein [Serratia sp. S1B]|nr:fimbrial protein [Serratia sp. S1B]